MIARDIDYNFPEAGYFILIGFIWFILFFALASHRQTQLNRLAPVQLLSLITVPRSSFFTWLKTIAFILAWIFGCLALMEPKTHARYIHTEETGQAVTNQQPPRTLLFAIDVSASMEIKDTRLGVPRLDEAKEIAQSIASLFTGSNVGVYAFTSIATKLSPPTPDALFAQLMIQTLRPNEGDTPGTDFLASFKTIHDLFLTQPSDMQYFLILISDGGDTTWLSLQGDAKAEREQQILAQFKPANGVIFKALTIGEGSEIGGLVPDLTYQGSLVPSKLESGLLQKISSASNSKYYLASQYSTLALAQQVARDILQTPYDPTVIPPSSEKVREESLTYDLYFQYPLALALLFLGLGIFLPETQSKKGKKANE